VPAGDDGLEVGREFGLEVARLLGASSSSQDLKARTRSAVAVRSARARRRDALLAGG